MNTRPDIFLSYNREDHATARHFAEAFECEGFKVWWDQTLKSGEAYDEVTENALKTAKAVVVLWSKKSVVSRWVRAEATVADRNKTLVPAMIEPCERPIMFELTQTAELSHWQGAADDRVWLAFLSDVKRFVEKESPPPLQPTVEQVRLPDIKPGERGDAPSLAVLPFTNRSGLAEDEVFAIGMVEDVIDALSQGANVRVIASSATAGFQKGAITDLPAVARQLGVRYLLEGNVRRSGSNLRVTSQLVEAASSAILWTQKFERPLSELAALQEELVLEVASNLDVQVYRIEMERALKKPDNLTAWEAVTRANAASRLYDSESARRVIEEAGHAIAIAPDYGLAHATFAMANAVAYFFFSPDNSDEVRRIRGHAERALALDPDNTVVLANAAQALNYLDGAAQALRHAERAVQLSPNMAFAHYVLGVSYNLTNRYEAALTQFDTQIRLSPGWFRLHATYGWQLNAHIRNGRWDEAIRTADQAAALNPNFSIIHIQKAILFSHDGRVDAAREAMTLARQLEPERTSESHELVLRRAFAGREVLEEALFHFHKAWASTEVAS